MNEARKGSDERPPRTAAEWVSFAVSGALLAVLVAVIAMQIPGEHTPPALTVTRAGAIREAGGSFYVPVDVENAGDETAQNVQVLASLKTSDGEEVIGDQVVDFLAGGEVKRLEFVFDEDPADGELTLTVSGYGVP